MWTIMDVNTMESVGVSHQYSVPYGSLLLFRTAYVLVSDGYRTIFFKKIVLQYSCTRSYQYYYLGTAVVLDIVLHVHDIVVSPGRHECATTVLYQ